MSRRRASTTRFIEMAGLSCVGKTTQANAFATLAPVGTRVGGRPGFSAPLRRGAYFALMVREARRWYSLYRLLRGTLSGKVARRRLRRYIKHLWRRRQQIRASDMMLVVEDEGFASWCARDLVRCPGLDAWLAVNIDLFYPRRVGRHAAEYVLVPITCSELLRTQRVHRRRLMHGGPAYARREFMRYGTFAAPGDQAGLQSVNALLRERGLIVANDGAKREVPAQEGVRANENIAHAGG